jgi:hypothetical protein
LRWLRRIRSVISIIYNAIRIFATMRELGRFSAPVVFA